MKTRLALGLVLLVGGCSRVHLPDYERGRITGACCVTKTLRPDLRENPHVKELCAPVIGACTEARPEPLNIVPVSTSTTTTTLPPYSGPPVEEPNARP